MRATTNCSSEVPQPTIGTQCEDLHHGHIGQLRTRSDPERVLQLRMCLASSLLWKMEAICRPYKLHLVDKPYIVLLMGGRRSLQCTRCMSRCLPPNSLALDRARTQSSQEILIWHLLGRDWTLMRRLELHNHHYPILSPLHSIQANKAILQKQKL